MTEEEIRMLLVEGNEQGDDPSAKKMISSSNVFEFNDTSVEQICTQKTGM